MSDCGQDFDDEYERIYELKVGSLSCTRQSDDDCQTAPLLPGQEYAWATHELYPGHGNLLTAYAPIGALVNESMLLQVVAALVANNDGLLTGISSDGPRPRQHLHRGAVVRIGVFGMKRGSSAEQFRDAPFPASALEPFLRLVVMRSRAGRWYIQAVTHHLVADDQSLALIASSLEFAVAGGPRTLPPSYGAAVPVLRARTRDCVPERVAGGLRDVPIRAMDPLSTEGSAVRARLTYPLAQPLKDALVSASGALNASPTMLLIAGLSAMVLIEGRSVAVPVYSSQRFGRKMARLCANLSASFLVTIPKELEHNTYVDLVASIRAQVLSGMIDFGRWECRVGDSHKHAHRHGLRLDYGVHIHTLAVTPRLSSLFCDAEKPIVAPVQGLNPRSLAAQTVLTVGVEGRTPSSLFIDGVGSISDFRDRLGVFESALTRMLQAPCATLADVLPPDRHVPNLGASFRGAPVDVAELERQLKLVFWNPGTQVSPTVEASDGEVVAHLQLDAQGAFPELTVDAAQSALRRNYAGVLPSRFVVHSGLGPASAVELERDAAPPASDTQAILLSAIQDATGEALGAHALYYAALRCPYHDIETVVERCRLAGIDARAKDFMAAATAVELAHVIESRAKHV